jgi:hypothetical protein
MKTLHNKSTNIKVEGHRGKWYVVDAQTYTIQSDKSPTTLTLFLVEHQIHGDEAACLILMEDGTLFIDDVWNGWDELEEYWRLAGIAFKPEDTQNTDGE